MALISFVKPFPMAHCWQGPGVPHGTLLVGPCPLWHTAGRAPGPHDTLLVGPCTHGTLLVGPFPGCFPSACILCVPHKLLPRRTLLTTSTSPASIREDRGAVWCHCGSAMYSPGPILWRAHWYHPHLADGQWHLQYTHYNVGDISLTVHST